MRLSTAGLKWIASKKATAVGGGTAPSTFDSASQTPASPEIKGFGTGFFVAANGYLLTSHHVIKNAKSILVKSQSGLLSAKIVSTDSQNDIALLKVEGAFKPLPLVSSRDAKMGATIFTLGFPNPDLQGISPKLTKGEISSLAGVQDDPRHFQISVPVQPGNSGGPLVDDSGNVIGIVSARLNEFVSLASSGSLPQNVNYALKSSFLNAFLEAQSAVSSGLPKPRTATGQKLEDLVKQTEPSVVMVVVY
ncbi:MAG: trypsin-like peptidase domain-containing protein [Acidobacteria bacterium]|nr:trypsin-like peptidase domain-containing protein [Acidobacteriota bacterium]